MPDDVFSVKAPLRIHALVVDPNLEDLLTATSALTTAGFAVTATDNYRDGKNALTSSPPKVLVTDIRLGAHNGLQLALRARGLDPEMTVIVTSAHPDPVLALEAQRMGATFVTKPLGEAELLAAIWRTAWRRPGPDGQLEPVQAPFERRVSDRRAAASTWVAADRRRRDRRAQGPVWPASGILGV